jgi:hypothetical protein
MVLLKHGPGVQSVGSLTTPATINNQLTSLCGPEFMGLVYPNFTVGATKAIRMEMFDDPLGTIFLVE